MSLSSDVSSACPERSETANRHTLTPSPSGAEKNTPAGVHALGIGSEPVVIAAWCRAIPQRTELRTRRWTRVRHPVVAPTTSRTGQVSHLPAVYRKIECLCRLATTPGRARSKTHSRSARAGLPSRGRQRPTILPRVHRRHSATARSSRRFGGHLEKTAAVVLLPRPGAHHLRAPASRKCRHCRDRSERRSAFRPAKSSVDDRRQGRPLDELADPRSCAAARDRVALSLRDQTRTPRAIHHSRAPVRQRNCRRS